MKYSNHQQKQLEVIEQIESQIKNNDLKSNTVIPILDSENDTRICLTGVHIPSDYFKQKIEDEIIKPLKAAVPEIYFFPQDALHITIKNIRVINDPAHFTYSDIVCTD